MGNRKKALAAVVAVAVAFGAGGWFLGQNVVKDPREVAAATAPPPMSLVTVPVDARELTDDIVTRVSVLFDDTAGVSVPPSTTQGTQVVTGRVPERNTVLANGSVLIEVNERPFFVLEGELPASRTMRAGTTGPDVEQLEVALADLGLFAETPDPVFDEATEAAIQELYESEGYQPRELTQQERNELELAEAAVTNAEKSLVTAQEALTEAGSTETESQRLSRIYQWEQTQQQWADLQENLANWQDTDPEIQAATQVEKAAEERWLEAKEDSDKANALEHPETGEVPTVEEVEAYQKITDDLAKQLDEARADVAKVIAESDGAERAAEQLEAGRRQFEIDSAAYQERLANLVPDTTLQEENVTVREDALEQAKTELAELEARLGPYLPDDEFIFLSNLPRNISSVGAQRGSILRTGVPVVQVAGDVLLVEGAVTENQRPELSEGDPVIIDDPALDLVVNGTFSRLDDVTDGNTGYPGRYYFTVDLEDGDYDVEQLVSVGNFRMVVPIGRSEGEVLAVPRNALSTTADDQAVVKVERSPDETEFVPVTIGLKPEVGGYVEVTPINPGELKVGDQVVIQECQGDGCPDFLRDDSEDDASEDDATEDDATEDEADAESSEDDEG